MMDMTSAKVCRSLTHETSLFYRPFRCGLIKLSIIRETEAAGRRN